AGRKRRDKPSGEIVGTALKPPLRLRTFVGATHCVARVCAAGNAERGRGNCLAPTDPDTICTSRFEIRPYNFATAPEWACVQAKKKPRPGSVGRPGLVSEPPRAGAHRYAIVRPVGGWDNCSAAN